jgi:glycosyltransferase involved in cell wall biosynthesis
MNNRVIVAVTNDLSGDQRIHKVAVSLMKFGYEPVLVGRLLPGSAPLKRPYSCKRFRMLARRGAVFYAAFNIRLFFYLLFSRADTFLANDLDTLTAVFLAGKLRSKRIVYDSHEYFTEVPELVGRPAVKRVWEQIESRIFPGLTSVYTVNDSIADIYRGKYGIPVKVVRNLPLPASHDATPGHLPEGFAGFPIIIYQGALNLGRGLEAMIGAMEFLPQCRLLIAGDGDKRVELELLVSARGLGERIHFAGRVPFEQLSWYTVQASLGVSLEQDLGLNYHFALPNKLFDYMHAGVPVLASDLPEIRRVVEDAGFGIVISRFDARYISTVIEDILADPGKLREWSEAARMAAPRYVWETEEKVIEEIFPDLRSS